MKKNYNFLMVIFIRIICSNRYNFNMKCNHLYFGDTESLRFDMLGTRFDSYDVDIVAQGL